jgi:MurNAc alpha-1-phosphate uridylyltransferase
MNVPRTAMVLAAGLGTRLRPLTDERPKPLVEVGGVPLIDRTLDRLAEAGVARAVVNLHHKADLLRAHLAQRTRPAVDFSDERAQLLETGGGVAKALPLLGPEPFLVVNSDMIWRDWHGSSLHRLAEAWDDARMDALLLMQAVVFAIGYEGMGDFDMAADGRLTRRDQRMVSPFVFTGVQILHPRLFTGCPPGVFSLNRLYDRAQEAGRLFGLRHYGDWMDIGTHYGIAEAEKELARG